MPWLKKDELDTETVVTEVAAESQKPVEAQEPKRRRGAHFKAAQQDAVRDAEEAAEVADDSEKPAKKASGSCRPGRGFAGRAYPVKRQEKVNQVPEARAEKAVEPAEPEVREQKPVDEQAASDTETQGQQPAAEQTGEGTSSKPRRRRHRGGRSSNAQDTAENVAPRDEDAKVDAPMGQPKRQPAKEGKPERSQKQTSTSKRERNVQGDSKRKSQKKPESAAADTAAQQAESTTHGEVSAFALARVLGRQLLKVVPTPTALSKIRNSRPRSLRSRARTARRLHSALSTTRCPIARLPRKLRSSRLGSSKTAVLILRLPRAASAPTRSSMTKRLLTASMASA